VPVGLSVGCVGTPILIGGDFRSEMLTTADRELLVLAQRHNKGYHIATEWYLRGFQPQSYQYLFHHLKQPNITWLAGIASGKTIGSAASVLIDCITIPYFSALSTSVTAKQAELMFDMFMAWYEGNQRLAHLVDKISLRPWPVITFWNYSTWEFRTAGTDARFIRGSEYDRIVFDEAGLDFGGEIVKVLRGRLRGVRSDGKPRMARLDVITSPTDAPWLRERFYKGWPGSGKENLTEYFSLRTRTRDNKRLTEEQIRAMEAEYSDEWIQVEMNAEFPNYGHAMFPQDHVTACTSVALYDMAMLALHGEEGMSSKGWRVDEHPRHGITHFEAPFDPMGYYIIAGDPGTDDPPRRNAGVVIVMDANTGNVVYFDWVYGQGSYIPFLKSYKYALEKYKPYIRLIDATGTQKAMHELAFEEAGITVDAFNFSANKDAALNALSLEISNHRIFWPPIKGLIRQVSSYNRELDRKDDFAQDIVMTLAMLAFGRRFKPEDTESYTRPVRQRTVRSRRQLLNARRRMYGF
jgi:hypothetical protein